MYQLLVGISPILLGIYVVLFLFITSKLLTKKRPSQRTSKRYFRHANSGYLYRIRKRTLLNLLIDAVKSLETFTVSMLHKKLTFLLGPEG